ncbi:hypothetical protein [Flavihumibacter solisilvae]|uniref:Uncharacterized protein n=1 Tax=Flavihumibacter solisilvae TaxID=1349421 RepID=A0A0C1L566_9BACT|nr:hypothetical protein [Flavihumibacter solisilvae]KIC90778.1 hypothetical protein OI18_23150 [Flavihumibacter solisilvae]
MFRFDQPSRKWLAMAALTAITVTGISWTDTIVHTAGLNHDIYSTDGCSGDTVPGTRSKKYRSSEPSSLDDHIKQLEKAQLDLQRELGGKDWDKIEREMETALAKINTKEMEEQIAKAMKEVNLAMDKIRDEQVMRQLDMEKLQKEMEIAKEKIQKEFKNADWDREIRAAMEEAKKATREMSKINEQQLKAELDRAKDEMARNKVNIEKEIARARDEMKNNKFHIKESLETARRQIDATKLEFEGYKTMILSMEKEGIIKDPKNYRIEYNDGKLTVDGKLQPESVTNRYKKYFSGKKTVLVNEKDKFDLEKGDEND